MSYPALRAFLDDSSRPADALRYHEAQGFLFAVATAPEPVMPSEWLPVVLEGLPDDKEATEAIVTETMTLYEDVMGGVADDEPALPADCAFREDVLANFEKDAPVSQWARGFIHGHTWLEESWDALMPDELEHDIGLAMLVLSFFASMDVANELMNELRASDLETTAEKIRGEFQHAMRDYARIGLAIEAAAHTPVRVDKVGRNDPCPCGSGRKYKKCCGA